MPVSADNVSLREKLKTADVFDEFVELMFDAEMHYDELLEKLESWNISSSLGALSRFKAAHIGWWSMERAKNEEREFLTTHGDKLDDVTRNLVKTRLFQAAANPNTSTKDVLKMKDLLIREAGLENDVKKLAEDVRQRDEALKQKQVQLDLQQRRVEALEAQAAAAAEKLNDLRDPEKAEDPEIRQRILDEVDRAMGIKKS